jgi:hypothetical protein
VDLKADVQGMSEEGGLTINPKTGEPVYFAEISSDSDIGLMHLQWM